MGFSAKLLTQAQAKNILVFLRKLKENIVGRELIFICHIDHLHNLNQIKKVQAGLFFLLFLCRA